MRVFDEVYGNVRSTLSLKRDLGFDPIVQGSLPTIMQMNELALQQDDPDVAFNLAETGYHLISIAKILASKMEAVAGKAFDASLKIIDAADGPDGVDEKMGDAAAATIKTVGKGLDKGCAIYADHLVDLFTDPANTIASDLVAPFKLVKKAFSKAFIIVQGNHKDRARLWQQIEAMAKHVQQQPEDIVAVAMQFFTPAPTFVALGAVAKATKLTRIAAAVKNNKKAPPLAVQGVQPLPQLVATGTAVAQKAHGTLANEVLQAMQRTGKNIWRHLFLGDVDTITGAPSGFHLEGGLVGKLIKGLVLSPDQHGVYAGFYKQGQWGKFSCFFPKNWSRIKVREKILEALNHVIENGKGFIIGESSEGIKIKIVFSKKRNDPLKIHSAFPLYQGERDTNKLLKMLGRDRVKFPL